MNQIARLPPVRYNDALDAESVRLPRVQESLAELEKQVTELGENWSKVKERIGAILRLEPSSTGEENAPPTGSVALADTIDSVRRQAARITQDIIETRNRIEL